MSAKLGVPLAGTFAVLFWRYALVGDDPLALTPESLHVMHLRLNRFSGYITTSWQDHQVREVKP